VPSSPQSDSHSRKSEWKLALIVFGVSAVAVWWLAANRFFLSLDEGIYLAGAGRLLRGQAPYRDFFALTGPGSFWIEAAILKVLGGTHAHARLPMVLDVALLSAVVYWLTARLCGQRLALGVTFFFFALETRPLFRLYANHRWDSSALAILAVAFVYWGTEQPRFIGFFAAGLFAAFAAWITPSLLALAVVLGFWLLLNKELRNQWRPYMLGLGLSSVAAAGVLLLQDALRPMWHDLLWASTHYPAANRVPYGYGAIAPGGLMAVYAGASLHAAMARTTGLAAVLLPPLLPLGVYFVWLFRRWRNVEFNQQERLATLLMIASFGLVLSAYPRWSADQLLFVAPIFYVLAAYLLDQLLKPRTLRAVAFAGILGFGVAALSYSVIRVRAEPTLDTPVGRVRAESAERALIQFTTRTIHPGDTLFVYPYLPIVYFLTGARNPTRYSFLQPGMMDAQNNAETLDDLRAHPPQWVFYFAFSPGTYQGIWPGADPRALRETSVDQYVRDHYRPVDALQHSVAEFFILVRDQP
jgi:hypothetical protein